MQSSPKIVARHDVHIESSSHEGVHARLEEIRK
jgi:hypothetical protein